jgi:hypothetical protein
MLCKLFEILGDTLSFVPAKAGTQQRQSKCLWVPAYAGTNE